MSLPITTIAADLGWMPISFVNAYFLGKRDGPWVLVDTGIPGRAREIMEAARERFGAGARPEAIVLTHGHFDHAGNAGALANEWDVPIYAHHLELPYLSGRSSYPPQDPTIGGAIAFLSRFMPSTAQDLSDRLRELPDNNKVPGLDDWEWMATPGHSPGHVSLFRSSDRVLVSGDALATMDMDSWSGLLTRRQMLARAGAPFNCDWDATEQSVNDLAKLRPSVVAAGHGVPISRGDVATRVQRFATRFRRPRRGRYVWEAARTDERGVISVPPAPLDPVPFATAAGLLLVGVVLGAGLLEDERR